jgi:hypothetical protein
VERAVALADDDRERKDAQDLLTWIRQITQACAADARACGPIQKR